MNKIIPDEYKECIALVEAVNWKYPYFSELFAHIPNGGKRTKREAVKFKKMGVKRGMPDYILCVPRGVYHGCFIEVKRKEDGDVSLYQRKRIELLREQGYFVDVAEGMEDGLSMIHNYLKLKENESLTVKFLT